MTSWKSFNLSVILLKSSFPPRRIADKGRVAIATRLRRETTLTLKRLAELLVPGSGTNGAAVWRPAAAPND